MCLRIHVPNLECHNIDQAHEHGDVGLVGSHLVKVNCEQHAASSARPGCSGPLY